MNIKLVLNTLGKLFLLIAGCMAIPLIMAMVTKSKDCVPFQIAFVLTIALGLTLKFGVTAKDTQFSFREAFAISAFAWLGVGFVGCIPMFITDYFGYQPIFNLPTNAHPFFTSFCNCYFEAMSGFSGTGATVISDIEAMPHPLLFWRCFHNGLGGMGILVLFVAILPSLGSAGTKLFRSESSISSSDSSTLFPKIADLARGLWYIYIGMTVVLTTALMIAGMSLFDALCHSFAAMGTGGFSTKNTSIAWYDSLPIELILVLFMFLSSLNCLLVRSLLTGHFKNFFSNTEFKVYLFLVSSAILATSLVNYCFRDGNSFGNELRGATFTIVSLVSSTGLTTVDYDLWHTFPKILLVLLMLMGGCASSTSGGLKVMRIVIFAKWIQREFKKMLRPHGVFPILVQDTVIENKSAEAAVGYCLLYLGTLLGFTALISLFENDAIGSFSGVLTCLSGVGPGFESLGPTHNFGNLSNFTKLLMSFCMALGRLEMMAFFVLLSPKIWKK
jgi:trk system potassium uptake protein TrkH